MHKNLITKKKALMFIFTIFCLQFTKTQACEFCLEETSKKQESQITHEQQLHHIPYQEPPYLTYGKFTYIKLGGSFTSTNQKGEGYPAIGFGKRFELEDSAVDISMNFGGTEKEYQYSFPKIMYLHYLNPHEMESLYLGAGLSWGGIRTYRSVFEGILGELAIGYEFQRMSPICIFVELDISQGLLSTRKRGKYNEPAVMLTAGVGY